MKFQTSSRNTSLTIIKIRIFEAIQQNNIMKKLFLSLNYLVALDATDELIGEYSKGHSIYKETDEAFIIKEDIDRGELAILKSEVDSGEWLDAETDGTAYTQATLRDFLRACTGFKTASGGSGADLIFTLNQNGGDGVPDINIIENTTGITPSIIKIANGTFDLSLGDSFDQVGGLGSTSVALGSTFQKSAVWGENMLFQSSLTPPFTTWVISASIQFGFPNSVLRIVSEAGSDRAFPTAQDEILDGTQIFQIVLPTINV